MKLKNIIRFRHIRIQKLTRVQIIIRVCFTGAAVCLIFALLFFFFIDKDYEGDVKSGTVTLPLTEYITVDLIDTPLYIYPADGDEITVNYVSDTVIDIYDEGGRLFVVQNSSFVVSLFAREQYSYRVELYLPDAVYKSINLSSVSGNVYVPALQSYMMSVKSKTGRVKAGGITCSGAFNLECDTAQIDITFAGFSGGKTICRGGNVRIGYEKQLAVQVVPGSVCRLNGERIRGVNGEETDPGTLPLMEVECTEGSVNISTGINAPPDKT